MVEFVAEIVMRPPRVLNMTAEACGPLGKIGNAISPRQCDWTIASGALNRLLRRSRRRLEIHSQNAIGRSSRTRAPARTSARLFLHAVDSRPVESAVSGTRFWAS